VSNLSSFGVDTWLESEHEDSESLRTRPVGGVTSSKASIISAILDSCECVDIVRVVRLEESAADDLCGRVGMYTRVGVLLGGTTILAVGRATGFTAYSQDPIWCLETAANPYGWIRAHLDTTDLILVKSEARN
jgi:hypothetical protein